MLIKGCCYFATIFVIVFGKVKSENEICQMGPKKNGMAEEC